MANILKALKSKKARPWVIGGGVLIGVFVLYNLLRGSGGSSGQTVVTGGPSEALQAAQLESATAIALGQQAANVEISRGAQELQGFMYAQDSARDLAELQVQRDTYVADRQADLAMYQAEAQTALGLAGLRAQENIALSQEATARFGIQAQENVQLAGFEAQARISESQFSFLTAQDTNRAETEQMRIQEEGATNRYLAKKQASASKSSSIWGAVGTIAMGAMMMMSDERMKKDIRWTGNRLEKSNPQGRGGPTEYGTYDWSWRSFPGGYNHGVIAQEIAIVKNDAVMTRRGRLAVNYEAIA